MRTGCSGRPERTSSLYNLAPAPVHYGGATWKVKPIAMERSVLVPYAAMVAMRWVIAVIFLAHAGVRLWAWTVPQFGVFLESVGFPYGETIVLAISAYEIFGSIMLALGIWVRYVTVGLVLIVAMGIVLIHARLGWFVGEHGTGGAEFSVLLITSLIVLRTASWHSPGNSPH